MADLEIIIQKIDHIIAVGTTSLRTLESLYWLGVNILKNPNFLDSNNTFFIEKLSPYQILDYNYNSNQAIQAVVNEMNKRKLKTISGQTAILIVPGYNFHLCNGIITNFHQPKSTLIVLIESLIGKSLNHIQAKIAPSPRCKYQGKSADIYLFKAVSKTANFC